MSAHDEAVAAAEIAYGPGNFRRLHDALAAYLRHMRAAGFVVTTVPGEMPARALEPSFGAGFNACRAEMLANAVEVSE